MSVTTSPSPEPSRSPTANRRRAYLVWKRVVDLAAAGGGLFVLSPVMLLIAAAVRWTSSGPVLFRQTRIGRDFRPFHILKFRTMVADAPATGAAITVGADPRITGLGRLLRRFKLDELPQLINVVQGDMSLVGPRPEVPRYVEMFPTDFQTILTVRPGITDLASLRYRDEAALLARASDPEQEYVTRVLPAKIELAKEYMAHSSLAYDLRLVLLTVFHVWLNRE